MGLSTLLQKVDSQTQKSADSAARLQAQYARLAQSQGNTSQATNILSNALQNNGGASARVVTSMATQLSSLQRGGSLTQMMATQTQSLTSVLGGLGGQLSSLGGSAGQFAGSLGQLAGSFGTLGGIGAAIGLGKVAIDLSVAGANADLLRERFDSLAVAAGTTGEALIAALRTASGGEISDLNLTLAANKAQLLGVADSAEEFGVLMGIARDRAQQMGISTTQAFNDLTTGLGRGSALILDNLGIIVSVKEANEAYAQSLGKTAAALTEAEQKQALINSVLAQGRASLEATGGAVQSQAGIYAQFSANIANATSGIGSFLSGGLAPLAGQFNQTVVAVQELDAANSEANARLLSMISTTEAETAALAAFDATMTATGSTTQAEAAYQAVLAQSRRDAAAAAVQAAADTQQLSGAFDANRTAVLANAGAMDLARTQIASVTGELGANAQASLLATAQQAAQTQATANLTAQTTTAVNAFLALNPSIDAAGIASQVAAGKIPALIGQLASLRVAAYSARDAVAALAAQQGLNTAKLTQPGGVGINAPGITSGRNNSVAAVLALQTANKKASEDAIAGDLAIAKAKGQTAKEVSLLRQQQQGLNKDSLAYKQIEASIITASKPSKTGGGGAGGSAKISDQTKLNNQLLTNQASADDKFEDAAAAHQQRLLTIAIDFAKKTLEQQKQNEVSKRQSQADFYDRLTSSDLNKKQGGSDALKQIDADYQAAYQKSQELAQAGNAKMAADYLSLKSKQAADELTYQESVAKAKAEKDKAEVGRLEAIHKLRQDAAAEEEKQLLAGGDANVNAKQQALDDESTKYAEAQEKVGTAAERASERQIATAQRAGKAIDTTTLAIERQRIAYDGIGGAPGVSTSAAGSPSSPAITPAAAADPIAVALDGLRAAIAEGTSATRDAGRGVEGAVGRLQGRFAS